MECWDSVMIQIEKSRNILHYICEGDLIILEAILIDFPWFSSHKVFICVDPRVLWQLGGTITGIQQVYQCLSF